MKNKIINIIFVIAILIILGAIILNLSPTLEEQLHRITGWS